MYSRPSLNIWSYYNFTSCYYKQAHTLLIYLPWSKTADRYRLQRERTAGTCTCSQILCMGCWIWLANDANYMGLATLAKGCFQGSRLHCPCSPKSVKLLSQLGATKPCKLQRFLNLKEGSVEMFQVYKISCLQAVTLSHAIFHTPS